MTLVLTAALALLLATPARAELRTGHHGNPYPDDPPLGSRTLPVFDTVSLRYDDQAGSLEATIRFTTPLADPSSTSALRPFTVQLSVGDYLSTVCTGSEHTWLQITGRLGDHQPAELTDFNDFFTDDPLSLPVTKTFAPDRSAVTLSITDPHLQHLNLICAEAQISKDDDDRFKYSSGSFGFLLDGFSRLDGNLLAQAEFSMTDNIEFLDRDWGRPNKGRRNLAVKTSCRRKYRDTVHCRSSAKLKSVPGHPRLTVRGDLRFPQPYREYVLGPKWHYAMRGRIDWRHCPASLHPAKRLLHKRCRLNIRWRGTKDLSGAVLKFK